MHLRQSLLCFNLKICHRRPRRSPFPTRTQVAAKMSRHRALGPKSSHNNYLLPRDRWSNSRLLPWRPSSPSYRQWQRDKRYRLARMTITYVTSQAFLTSTAIKYLSHKWLWLNHRGLLSHNLCTITVNLCGG